MRIPHAVQVEDPRGLAITVAPDDWEHVIEGHPEMGSRFAEVLQTLRTPTVIQLSATDSGSHLYFWLKPTTVGRFSGLYVTVVVKIDEAAATGRMRTAYLTGRLGRGRVIWASKP